MKGSIYIRGEWEKDKGGAHSESIHYSEKGIGRGGDSKQHKMQYCAR